MNEGDDLQILVGVALDFAKSLTTMTAQMRQLQNKLKNCQIKLTAGLDQTASAAQIKADLRQISKGKNHIKVVGEVDQNTTKQNVNAALKRLKNSEIKITGILDGTATDSNIKSSLQGVRDVTAKADVEVRGAEQVDSLRQKMDATSGSAAGMAAKVYLARTALQMLRRATQEAIETVTELDSTVTDLSMATGQNREQTYDLLQDYNKLAGQLGATTSQVAKAADAWLRQGHSIGDTAILIQDAMILSKVSQLDSAAATDFLTASMKGYKIAAQDVIGVVDKLSAVDLVSATDAGGLAEAMSRTAVTADMAGISMDRLLGYLAVVGETTQREMSSIGTAFKTIFTRMSDIKSGKLELIDEDGTKDTLSNVETVLNGLNIKLRESDNEFRNFGDVLDDVAAKWDSYTDVQQAALSKAFAGTRQQENFRVLLENYDKAREYMEVAADSAGTATEKFALYTDSIEAKAASFVAAAESLTLDTLDSELVKDLIDAGTAVIEFTEQAGLLKATLLSLGVGGVLKGVSLISSGFKTAYHEVLNLGTAINTLRSVDTVGGLSAETLNRLGQLTKGLSNEQLKLALASKQLSTAQMTAILTASGLTAEEAAQKLQTLGLATAQGTAIGATWSLSAAMTGLGASIKAAFLSNPIGMIMLAVSAIVMAVETVSNAQEEARQAAIEAADAAGALSDEVVDLTDRYLELSEAIKTDDSAKGDLLSTQNELIDKLDLEKGRIEELTAKYGSLTEAIKAAAVESLQGAERDLRGGLSGHKEELLNGDGKSLSHITTTWDSDAASANHKGLNALVDAGYISAGSFAPLGMELWLPDDGEFDPSTVEGILNAYERLGEMLDIVSDVAPDSEVYDALYDTYNKCSSAVKGYQDSITALNTNLAEQYMLQNLIGQELPETEEEFDTYRKNVVNAAKASGEFVGSDADIISSVDQVLQGQSQFAGFYADELVNAETATDHYAAQLQKLPDVLSSIKSSYEALEAAQGDMADGGGLSEETIAALAKSEENYLDYLYEENGVVKLNTEAWKENANAKMLGEMNEIQKEIDSLRERNTVLQESIEYYTGQQLISNDGGIWSSKISEATAEIQKNNEAISENQGKLAIYSSLYGSITGDLNAYTSALQNFSNIASAIDSVSGSFQTLADLQAAVADGFTMSLDKALEFAKVYPEILNNAQVSADGQIVLNEGVVNSFLQGKKAELDAQIDAQIAQLEADKAVLQAKTEAAQAQLDLAKAVGEGEGQITKELAEYRINAGNIVAQALIDAGIDEATAFKLAAAAMAQNAEEFDRVAMEVCTDVNGNFNQAAFAAAQAVYNNMNQAKTDVASFAQQCHEAARAMAGVAGGNVQGSSGVQGGSGGGVGGSGIQLNLTSGSFEGTDYTYTVKESNLEDFISQIELDISSYKDAIAQIDGQIATLQALKNIPLKDFKSDAKSGSGGGSSGGSGGGSAKEVEEYIADIDAYREAIERLRKAQQYTADTEQLLENTDDLKQRILLERQLIGAYAKGQEALHNLNNQRDSTITEGVKALRELGFEVQYNAETNEFWISNMEYLNELTADSVGEYGSLQEATNALRKDTEGLIDSLTDLNDENRETSQNWLDLKNSMGEADKEILNLLDEIVTQASETVDTIQDVYDTLHKAADEYAASGYITMDTLQSIIKLGQKYVAYLMDENGELIINEDRIRAVIAAKAQQLAIESSLSYVEALRIAKQANDIATLNDLLYATQETTDATWGLVYANLALAGLDKDQYQAALNNINAIRAMADSAVHSIGKTASSVTDELNNMRDGVDDILKYVMDMLKQQVQDQIDGIEAVKEAYSEEIERIKEVAHAKKEEDSYEKDKVNRLKEIAKLQARIDALSLAASQGDRKAQAERDSLLEELGELQEELAETQADHALEAQQDALDKMEEAYHQEKDEEIKTLEDSISSYQKLYDMAIEYISTHWDTLYSELIAWNTQYGDVLNSEISTAWDNCLAAAQRYGSYVSALNSIGADIESSKGDNSANIQVGTTNYESSSTNEEMIHAIIKEMYRNTQAYSAAGTDGKRKLSKNNLDLGARLSAYGVNALIDGKTGVWYVDRIGGEKLYEKYRHYTYHTGGFAGDTGTLKDNEILAKLEKGEPVLTERMWTNLVAVVDRMDTLAQSLTGPTSYTGSTVLPDMLKGIGSSTVNNVINRNQPIQIDLGDTIINGGSDPAPVIAEKVRTITRENINQIAKFLRISL